MDFMDEAPKPAAIVTEHFKALEAGNFERARMFLADDFKYVGWLPRAMGPREYVEMHRALMSGISDWKFNFSILGQQNGRVQAGVRVTGVHIRELKLPFMPEVGTVKATRKKISLPEEKVTLSVKNEKIVTMRVESVPSGGMGGLLGQLGVQLKKAG